jgi:drug/metabolite transporter (DMT)-like permease
LDNLASIFPGVLITLIGTILFSGVYVLNEIILSTRSKIKGVLSHEELCARIGSFSLMLCLSYIFLFTAPQFSKLVIQPMEEHKADKFFVFIVYLALVLASFFHSLSYFKLLDSIGAVSTGIIQALRAVSVFFLSSLFFCHSEPSQCFNAYKGLSTLTVCIGVVAFSASSRKGI